MLGIKRAERALQMACEGKTLDEIRNAFSLRPLVWRVMSTLPENAELFQALTFLVSLNRECEMTKRLAKSLDALRKRLLT